MHLAAAALLYTGITAVLFRNLLPVLTTHLYSDPGDPLLNTAILAWNATHLPLTGAWWNFPSFAPVSGVMAFTEHLLLTYPIASPIVWITGNPVLAYNVVYLIAGLAFAFSPYQAVHLSHVQLMLLFGMPFTLLWLHRYLTTSARQRRTRALIWFAAGWLVTALSSVYLLFFFPILVALWCGWFVRPREWRRLRRFS